MRKFPEMGGRGGQVSRRILLVSGGAVALGAVLYGAWPDQPTGGPPAKLAVAGVRTGMPASTGTGRRPTPSAGATGHATPGHPADTARPHGGRSPASPGHGPGSGAPQYYVDDGPKVIALTIDDGPSPVYTPQVLAILARYKVTAAFSMIGQNVSYYPGVAREVADAGHMIVNHTWDHANLSALSTARTRTEIDRAAAEIHAATGTVPRMFRAPYGAWSKVTLNYCAREGLTPLDWSVDPRDWARPGVGAIVNTILATTRTGSIILEHDGGGDRSQTVAALGTVIPRLLDEGYHFAAP